MELMQLDALRLMGQRLEMVMKFMLRRVQTRIKKVILISEIVTIMPTIQNKQRKQKLY